MTKFAIFGFYNDRHLVANLTTYNQERHLDVSQRLAIHTAKELHLRAVERLEQAAHNRGW